MKIKATAPARISLFGGGSDVEPFASQYGGAVLSLAINLRQHLTLYTGSDLPESPYTRVPHGIEPKFVYSILDEFGINDMHLASVVTQFDGVIGAGLGSSASVAVALVGAISKEQNLGLSRTDIAERAWEIETEKFGHYGGRQDQYASAFGGLNVIQFGAQVTVNPLSRQAGELLLSSLVLIDSGYRRQGDKQQEALKTLDAKRTEHLSAVRDQVIKGLEYLSNDDIEGVGQTLHRAWKHKKLINKVSTPQIDQLYEQALQAGAWGGKLLGSGGGGYMVFMVDPAKRKSFLETLGIRDIDFSIDWNGVETKRLDD